MASDKSRKQFPNYLNDKNKKNHDNYELDGIEDIFVFQHLLMTKYINKLCRDITSF